MRHRTLRNKGKIGLRTAAAALGCALACGGGAPAEEWTRTYGDEEAQWVDGLALAPNGDIVVLGQLKGDIVFDGLEPAGSRSEGGDEFLLRLSAGGAPRFAWRTAALHWRDVAASDGLTVVAGKSPEETRDARKGLDQLPESDEGHAVAAFDAEGALAWTFDAPGLRAGHQVVRHDDGWVVAGQFRGTLELDGNTWTSQTEYGDLVVLWLSDAGALRESFVKPGVPASQAMAVGPDGLVVLGGADTKTWVLAVDPGDPGNAKDPELTWSHTFGSTQMRVEDLLVDSEGVAWMAGTFGAPVDLGNGRAPVSSGAFVVRVESEGTVASTAFSGPQRYAALSLAWDGTHLLVHGKFVEALVIGDERHEPSGFSDLYLARFDRELKLAELEVWGSPSNEAAGRVAVGPTHEVIAAQCSGVRDESTVCNELGDVIVRRRKRPGP